MERKVLVTGGAGYVGSMLVPKLLARGFSVRVLDTFFYGHEPLSRFQGAAGYEEVEADIRDRSAVERAVDGCDAVIHLACISNDPSFELDPDLGKSINFDAFEPLVVASKKAGVKRFLYVSSSSVYGVSEAPEVREDHPLLPLTDYSKYKALCEPIALGYNSKDFETVVLRPATVCGYSTRMRFDLSVNILTNHAINNKKILIFGGTQMRPNIHIDDITDLYVDLLDERSERIAGKTFNAGFQNRSINDIADIVRTVVQKEMPELGPIALETQPTDDLRSYRVNSDYIERELGFRPRHTLEDAVLDLTRAFRAGRFPNSMTDSRYFNVKLMLSAPKAEALA